MFTDHATEVLISSSLRSGTKVQEDDIVTLVCTTDRNPPGKLSLVTLPLYTVVDSAFSNRLSVALQLDRTYNNVPLKCRLSDMQSQLPMVSSEEMLYVVHCKYTEISNWAVPSQDFAQCTL